MNKFFLLFHTLRYLKWTQVYYRILRKLLRPKVTDVFDPDLVNRGNARWCHALLYHAKLDASLNATFLNFSKRLSLPVDWNVETPSKLWVYNLHYFEDLLAVDSSSKSELHTQLLERWVAENPVGIGNGWEPYPISLRVVNVLKAWLGGLPVSSIILKSIFDQASYLSNDLEKHLLGNHYFVNLKALLFAGVVFGQLEWKRVATSELLKQIPEQILPDGANFELTPMYHSIILVDMLDIYNLYRAYPDQISEELLQLVRSDIPKMLAFMESMSHPDGEVSFFNDSVGGVAASKVKIQEYAYALGFEVKPATQSQIVVTDNAYSGYYSVLADKSKLIFDAANIGPDYIPGHAHADTLSFEMSINKERVFVNSGVSEYGIGEERLRQRKTAAHNTVEIDGNDSSQVWSGFRVARRATIVDRSSRLLSDGEVKLHASHNGYKSIFGGCTHARNLIFSKHRLIVIDKIIGRFKLARIRFHFHPNLKVSLVDRSLTVRGVCFIMRADVSGADASLLPSTWHPEFGVSLPNQVLEIECSSGESRIEFSWDYY